MTPDTLPPPAATLDLTGLPADTVRQVRAIVDAARRSDAPPAAPAAADLERLLAAGPDPSPEEFRRLLDEMASLGTGQSLPADWSRADLYDDHD